MAVHLATGNDYLQLFSNLLPLTGNRSWCCWIRIPTYTPLHYYPVYYSIDDPAVYQDWEGVWIQQPDVFGPFVTDPMYYQSGLTGGTYAGVRTENLATSGQWTFIGGKVTAANVHTLYVNGQVAFILNTYGQVSPGGNVGLAQTFTKNMSTAVIGREMLGGDSFSDIGLDAGMDVAYFRAWNTALTNAQMAGEYQSPPVPVLHTNLWRWTPLESDLLDYSGTGHAGWTQVGSGTFVNGPVTVTPITVFPLAQTVAPADFNGTNGSPNGAWFRYTTALNEVIGATADTSAAYTNLTVNLQDATNFGTGVRNFLQGSVGDRRPWWYYLSPGTYIIRATRLVGSTFTTIPSAFTLHADRAPTPTVPLPFGSYLINDDSVMLGPTGIVHGGEPFPAIVYYPDGTLAGFAPEIPAGEIGDSIAGGTMLWNARFDPEATRLQLWSRSLTLIAAFNVNPPLASGFAVNISHTPNDFYVFDENTRWIHRVSPTGTVTNQIAQLPSNATAFGVNPAGTIAYWVRNFGVYYSRVLRHDLTTNTPMSDLYVAPVDIDWMGLSASNRNPGEILVLKDESVVVIYHTSTPSPDRDVLLHIAADGTLLHSYTYPYLFSGGPSVNHAPNHIHYSTDDPNSILVWYYTDDNVSDNGSVEVLNLATGARTPLSVFRQFSTAQVLTSLPVGLDLFGPSNSCTLVGLFPGGSPPPPTPTAICPPGRRLSPVDTGCIMPIGDF